MLNKLKPTTAWKPKVLIDRGYEIKSPINVFTINIKNDVEHNFLDDFILASEIWITDNCSGKYSIKVYGSPLYEIPNNVKVEFELKEDALLYKLGPMWHNFIDNDLKY